MPRLRALAVTFALLLVAAPARSASAEDQDSGAPRVPEYLRARAEQGRTVRVIVGIRAHVAAEGDLPAEGVLSQRAHIRDRVDEVLNRVPSAAARARRFRTIPFFAVAADLSTLDQLASDPDVTSIEEDLPDRLVLAESVPRIGAPEAWNAGYSGSGWTVAVLDTGVEKTHLFLAGKVVSEACYSNAGGGGGGISLCPGGAPSSTMEGSGVDCSSVFAGCYHGTHVAGIAAGHGTTFSGVAREANLISVQIFTGFPAGDPMCGANACVVSYTSDQILGLERVLALRTALKIAAVNMSLGGSSKYADQATCDAANAARKAAIDNLRSVGIATVIAAGNSGYLDGLSAPACISSAVSAGSTADPDAAGVERVSVFSNTAPFLGLVAPGEWITSSVPGGGFQELSGTSMATPHVAGAWAVLKSHVPGAGVDQILNALRSTADAVADGSREGAPFARIRVDRAMNALTRPQMALDAPLNDSTVATPFQISGWALDERSTSGAGVDAIHVWAFPDAGGDPVFLGAASYGSARDDVGAIYGTRFTGCGFFLAVPLLAPGRYHIAVYAHVAASGAFEISRGAIVTVQAPVSRPLSAIDVPADAATVTPSFVVAGWALDLAAAGGSGVDAIHVYAFPADGSGGPIFLGVGTQGVARPDVGAAFGAPFAASGYWLSATLAPGSYTLVVYARSTVSGLFFWHLRNITVREPGDPLMSIDAPITGAVTQPFLLAGWAIDRDAPAGPGVDTIHAWVFPIDGGTPMWLGVPAYGAERPDVAAIAGLRYGNCGFNLIVDSLPPGTYHIAVYVHSTVTGTFNQSRGVIVSVF